jgi:hypothetical protein
MPGFGFLSLGRLWFLAFSSLAVQSPAEGLIYYAEGEQISITTGGERSPHKAEDLRFFTLRRADLVQTGPKSFVEIRFPSGLLVKVAENSSFSYDGTGERGTYISLSLLYGRTRVISGWNGQLSPVVVRMGDTVADIVEGDIGLDYMVHPGEAGGLVPRAYAFSGSAELIPLARPAPGIRASRTRSGYVSDLPVIRLEAYESLSVGPEVERRSLGPEILSYWNQHNFVGHAPLTAPAWIASPPPSGEALSLSNLPASSFESPPALPTPAPLGDENPFLRANRVRQTALTIGTIFTTAGTAMEIIGYCLSRNDQAYAGDTIMFYGFIPAGLGFISLIIALAADSPSP